MGKLCIKYISYLWRLTFCRRRAWLKTQLLPRRKQRSHESASWFFSQRIFNEKQVWQVFNSGIGDCRPLDWFIVSNYYFRWWFMDVTVIFRLRLVVNGKSRAESWPWHGTPFEEDEAVHGRVIRLRCNSSGIQARYYNTTQWLWRWYIHEGLMILRRGLVQAKWQDKNLMQLEL
jgi:hypothetical protein